jgi:hypothetical protein
MRRVWFNVCYIKMPMVEGRAYVTKTSPCIDMIETAHSLNVLFVSLKVNNNLK